MKKRQLQTIESKYTAKVEEISSLRLKSIKEIESAIELDNSAALEFAVDAGINTHSEILSIINAEFGDKQYKELIKKADAQRPDYSLTVLTKYLSGNNRYNEEEKSTIFLSLILSVILDFSYFLFAYHN